MNDREKEMLPYFIYRPNMYCGAEKESIVAFVHGMEFGQFIHGDEENRNSFSTTLSKLLEEKFKIKRRAMGWIGQVEMYAKKKKIDFSEAFFELSKIIFPSPPKEMQKT